MPLNMSGCPPNISSIPSKINRQRLLNMLKSAAFRLYEHTLRPVEEWVDAREQDQDCDSCFRMLSAATATSKRSWSMT